MIDADAGTPRNRIRLSARTAALLALLALASGCGTMMEPLASPPALGYPPGACPEFMVVYHPYGSSDGASLAVHPVPRYSGWTEERMGRDLGRFSALGVDVVLVSITPSTAADDFRLGRYRRFAEIADRMGGAPRIALLGLPEHGRRDLSLGRLGQWVVTSGYRRLDSLYRRRGKVVVVLGPGAVMGGHPHPVLQVIRTSESAPAPGSDVWFWPRAPSSTPSAIPLDCAAATVYAGWRGSAESALANGGRGGGRPWVAARRRGRYLREGIWRALEARARAIVVSSWNDFANGDFIEPNDLDGEAACKALRSEVLRVKNFCRESASAGPSSVDAPRVAP